MKSVFGTEERRYRVYCCSHPIHGRSNGTKKYDRENVGKIAREDVMEGAEFRRENVGIIAGDGVVETKEGRAHQASCVLRPIQASNSKVTHANDGKLVPPVPLLPPPPAGVGV